MPGNISLRPVTGIKPDKDDLATLMTAYKDAYASGGTQPDAKHLEWAQNQMLSDGYPYVILDNGQRVGGAYICHYRHRGLDGTKTYSGGSIDTLGILEPYRNKGIGRAALALLMEEAANKYPEGAYLHIAYDPSNAAAKHLYTSMGFSDPIEWNGKNGWDAISLHQDRDLALKAAKLQRARDFISHIKDEAAKRGMNVFAVTDGASGISNNGNPAVRAAREAQVKWELEHGADPHEDWSKRASVNPVLYLGTTNPGKIREMTALLKSLGVTARTLQDIPDVPETARSYSGNARLKAETLSKLYGVPVISEDSGLSVRALHGAPGIRSGRYAGSANHNSADNVTKLLAAMQGMKDRSAAFVTAAAISDNGVTYSLTRRAPGSIADTPRGDKGFSYDTVFVPNVSQQTYAESGDKSGSSRDKAVKALIARMYRR